MKFKHIFNFSITWLAISSAAFAQTAQNLEESEDTATLTITDSITLEQNFIPDSFEQKRIFPHLSPDTIGTLENQGGFNLKKIKVDSLGTKFFDDKNIRDVESRIKKVDSLNAVRNDLSRISQPNALKDTILKVADDVSPLNTDDLREEDISLDNARDMYRGNTRKDVESLVTAEAKEKRIMAKKDSVNNNIDSIRSLKKKIDNVDKLSALENSAKAGKQLLDSVTKVKDLYGFIPRKLNIDSLMANTDRFSSLPALNGNKIKTEYLPVLDSLRGKHLSDERLKLIEKKNANDYKEILLKEKPSLKQKIFFEGILGLNSNNLNFVNISPAVGIMLTRSTSIGLGINFGGDISNFGENNRAGIRSFAKYELIEKKFYLQVEDNMTLTRLSEVKTQEGYVAKNISHAILMGAGFLINYSSSNSINLVLLYQVNKDKISTDFDSPFTIRLGLSMFK